MMKASSYQQVWNCVTNIKKKRSNMLIWQKKLDSTFKKRKKKQRPLSQKNYNYLTIWQWNILRDWYFLCLTFFLTFCDLAPLDPPDPVVGVRRYIRLNKSVVWGMEVSINSAKATVAGLSVFCFLKNQVKKK